jgi:hypothetical protein
MRRELLCPTLPLAKNRGAFGGEEDGLCALPNLLGRPWFIKSRSLVVRDEPQVHQFVEQLYSTIKKFRFQKLSGRLPLMLFGLRTFHFGLLSISSTFERFGEVVGCFRRPCQFVGFEKAFDKLNMSKALALERLHRAQVLPVGAHVLIRPVPFVQSPSNYRDQRKHDRRDYGTPPTDLNRACAARADEQGIEGKDTPDVIAGIQRPSPTGPPCLPQ